MSKRPETNLGNSVPAINMSGLHSRYVNPGELDKLCHLINYYHGMSFLEIGTNSGRTSLAVLRNCPTIKFAWGVDVPMDYKFDKAVQRREAPVRPGELGLLDRRYKCLLSRYGSFDLLPSMLPRFDVVFVDGDHSERAVRHDRELSIALGARLIIYHDDHGRTDVDVSRTLDELHTDIQPIYHVAESWLAYELIGHGTIR